MKKTASFISKTLLALAFALSFAGASAEAADMWSKVGRGLNNLAFFPLEIFYRPYEMHEKGESWPIAVAGGSLKGIGYAVGRLGVGVYEVLTFPQPGPTNYAPLMMPEHMVLSN